MLDILEFNKIAETMVSKQKDQIDFPFDLLIF